MIVLQKVNSVIWVTWESNFRNLTTTRCYWLERKLLHTTLCPLLTLHRNDSSVHNDQAIYSQFLHVLSRASLLKFSILRPLIWPEPRTDPECTCTVLPAVVSRQFSFSGVISNAILRLFLRLLILYTFILQI